MNQSFSESLWENMKDKIAAVHFASCLLGAGLRCGPLHCSRFSFSACLSLPLGGAAWVTQKRCAVGGGTKASPCCQESFEKQSCSCKGRPRASSRICPMEGCHVLTSLARPRLQAGSVIHICSEPSTGLRTGSPHRQAEMIYSDWGNQISSFLVKPSRAPSVCQHQGAPLSSHFRG